MEREGNEVCHVACSSVAGAGIDGGFALCQFSFELRSADPCCARSHAWLRRETAGSSTLLVPLLALRLSAWSGTTSLSGVRDEA